MAHEPDIAAPQLPLGELIDSYWALREEHKRLVATTKELGAQIEALNTAILDRLDAEETTLARGHHASASISEIDVATVPDWDAFYTYIKENDAFYLLERRPANKACRELFDSGVTIPGVSKFTKRSVNVRTL